MSSARPWKSAKASSSRKDVSTKFVNHEHIHEHQHLHHVIRVQAEPISSQDIPEYPGLSEALGPWSRTKAAAVIAESLARYEKSGKRVVVVSPATGVARPEFIT
jgi:hypothetical protein